MDVIIGNKVARLKVYPKKVPKIDVIHLHREIGDIIYTDFLQDTLQISKLQSNKKRVEDLLQKEKVENRAHQAQIKKLQVDLLVDDIHEDKGASTQKLLKEKQSAIQLLKRKLDILATWLIQTSEFTEIEKEKESLNTELINFKAILLKYEEKYKQWEKDTKILVEKEKSYETK